MINLNLKELHAEITKNITHKIVEQQDQAVTQFVVSAMNALTLKGEEITDYALVHISNPMEFTNDSSIRINSAWKICKLSELQNLPTYSD